MARPVVVDLRNVYHPDEMKKHGFVYVSVGRMPQQLPIDAPKAERHRSHVARRKRDAVTGKL